MYTIHLCDPHTESWESQAWLTVKNSPLIQFHIEKLMCKLEILHLHPILLTWLHNYISKEENKRIEKLQILYIQVISGVPQVHVLRPLLFLIYFHITSILLSEGTLLNILYTTWCYCIYTSLHYFITPLFLWFIRCTFILAIVCPQNRF